VLPKSLLELTEGKKGLQDMVIQKLPLKETQLCRSRTWSTCTEQLRIKGVKEQVTNSALDFNGTKRTIQQAEEFVANLTTVSTLVTAVEYSKERAAFAELFTCLVTSDCRIKPHYVMAQEVYDDKSISSVLERCNRNRKDHQIFVFVEYARESRIEVYKELLKRLLFAEMRVLTLVDNQHIAEIALVHKEVVQNFEQVMF
jgi:hypothetical protein